MKTICEELREKKLMVSDGAWGTMLMAQGLSAGACPELWNAEHPDAVRSIGRRYVEAGSDMITTNSFGGTCFKLESYGLAGRVEELNKRAAALSREAAGANKHVIASIGPTGKILMMGDVGEEELYEAFRTQACAFEAGGADAVLVETMSALDEAALAVRAVKENTRLEVLCTFTYDRAVDGIYRTIMGASPADMASAMLEAGADIIGTNCSQGPAEMVAIAAALRAAAPGVPILIQPNAGMPVADGDSVRYPETPATMAAYVPELVRAGATIIGGCCGTSPAHIRAIADAVAAARET